MTYERARKIVEQRYGKEGINAIETALQAERLMQWSDRGTPCCMLCIHWKQAPNCIGCFEKGDRGNGRRKFYVSVENEQEVLGNESD